MRLAPIAVLFLLTPSLGAQAPACDPGNAGLALPDGFCATRFAEVAGARHLAIAPNGDVFVARRGRTGGMTVLRDADRDGHAERVEEVATGSATGVVYFDGAVFLGHDDRIVRFPWRADRFGVVGPAVEVVAGLPTGGHSATTMAIAPDGAMYVDHGSRGNVCAETPRNRQSPGMRPCPELAERAGVWRYDAAGSGQTPATGRRWATGLRNAMALAVEPSTGMLYAAVHGRDELKAWPGFDENDSAEKPAEEFGAVPEGADYGWPYCFHDPVAGRKVLAPEYGGDGVVQGECARKSQPDIGFPGHWAPMSLAFYDHDRLGPAYRGGAFLAFHGSWNRAPLPQAGYRVVFIPFANGRPTGAHQTFATDADSETGLRASGVAVAPDGALFISSDAAGTIWRVVPNR
jgi:glucose/arabinose dehydrogenase